MVEETPSRMLQIHVAGSISRIGSRGRDEVDLLTAASPNAGRAMESDSLSQR